ncbi:MAG: CinA family protein [Candidatus Omnitrophica bacterium]|nr:CinA family protein [Candidatus Omnitrophota bacterium]
MEREINLLSKQIGGLLIEKRLTLAVAESCTGGLLSSSITDTEGSSKYFLLGVVAYSRVQKEKLLKIPPSILKRYSPVSQRTVKLMAENIRKIALADIGIGITGYAGPKGGRLKNPPGTVYIGLAFKGKTKVKKCSFKGQRKEIKKKAVKKALELLRQEVRE